MFSLRKKLMLGFGGILSILLATGTLSIVLLNRYSGTIDRIFRENIDSVTYGQGMKEAVEELEEIAESILSGEGSPRRDAVDRVEREFERNLALESGNITIPGERDIVQALEEAWRTYQREYEGFLQARSPESDSRTFYRTTLLPLGKRVRAQAQRVIDVNLQNIRSVDGQVNVNTLAAKRTMCLLLGIGVTFALVVGGVMSRSLLLALRSLTQSARDIERGNLDLIVPVRSRDEVGQLAEAFNSMAARLREFRRSNQARLLRTQRTTQLAIDSLPDAVAIFSPEGRVELANEAARNLFGLRPETDIASVPVNGLAEIYRAAAGEGRAVQPQGYESAIQVFNGQERFFLPQALPILDDDKQLVGVTLVLADVTHLHRLDEMKSGLLSVVAH